MKNQFWMFSRVKNDETGAEERALYLDGEIAQESWWDDEITPKDFKAQLNADSGPLNVWINSPGGDVFAGAQIYNMLREYKGNVTVKIDALAASAASVIAMAGDKILISPVGMIMIHNPETLAMGDSRDMLKAKDILDEVKNSIVNAYEQKTGLSRAKISRLMDDETWMNARSAKALGFVDGMLFDVPKEQSQTSESESNADVEAAEADEPSNLRKHRIVNSFMSETFSQKTLDRRIMDKLKTIGTVQPKALYDRLSALEH